MLAYGHHERAWLARGRAVRNGGVGASPTVTGGGVVDAAGFEPEVGHL